MCPTRIRDNKMRHVYKIFSFVLCLFVGSFASAQIFSYDFEQLNVGDHVAATIGEPWTTWNNAPGSAEDGVITDEQTVGNRSLKIDTGNDVVLKLGDKTAGAYRLSFDMYIPEGKEGYFNVIHEFAGQSSTVLCNVWFNSESNGNLINGMSMSYVNVVFPLNEWNHIDFEYYADDGFACIKINNEIACLGKSFNEYHGLGIIDFWPCSNNSDRNGFYIDNVNYEEIAWQLVNNVTASPNAINAVLEKDIFDNESYSYGLANEGNTMSRVSTWIDYGIGEDGGDTQLLHYDADPYYRYGNYNSNPYIEIGVKYNYYQLIDSLMIGKKITGMQYYVPYTFTAGATGPITFRIYKCIGFFDFFDMELLTEKEVNAYDVSSWLNIEFDEPISLRGFTVLATVGFQQANGGYPISLDAGPKILNADLVRLDGGSWFSLNSNSVYYGGQEYGNHNIRLICDGQPVVAGWAMDSYESWGDILYIGDVNNYPLAFNTSGLDYGEYEALLHVEVNNNPSLELTIPINLNVSPENVDENIVQKYIIYPNPTNGIVIIEAENIQNISIYNMLGEMVFESAASGNEFDYDFSNNESGVYLVRIETAQGVVTKRVTVM